MKTEQEKMLAGELNDPMDAPLVAGRERARDICQALNATREAEQQPPFSPACGSARAQ